MREFAAWREHSRMAQLSAAVWVAVALAAVVSAAVRAWVTDDIFITFRYCDNVLAGLGPVYNAGEHSEGYTHFLWFALLTAGRALHMDPIWLGRYAALPAYLGCLIWLVRLSGRLFPGRGGLWGVPVAMICWALHEDARRFASGGLETAAFTWALLVGFEAVAVGRSARRGAWGGWALAVATLLRPEGLLYTGLAGAFLAWTDRRALRDFVITWSLLAVPLFVFRMAYYGYPLPNPYYAKSGGLAYWSQGWIYLKTYFGSYFVLLLGLTAAVPVGRGLASVDPDARRTARALGLFFAAAVATILLVTRGGGDFMFARFFLPTTPLLLLLVEAGVQSLPRPGWRATAAFLCAGLMVVGIVRKHTIVGNKRNVSGIVDEPQFYPDFRMREIREAAGHLRECFAGTDATILVSGGQAALAYYTQYPNAVERFGLTDATIAHQPIRQRGRPGHEKFATPEYLFRRGVNLRFHFNPVRNVPVYSLIELGGVAGDIVVYDRALMDHLKTCHGARFLDFPIWLAESYLPSVPTLQPWRLTADWNQFQHFYFNHNADPEGLRQRLRAALAARGLTNLPENAPPVLVQDPGTLQNQ